MSEILLLATNDKHVVAVCEAVASMIGLVVRRCRSGREIFAALRRPGDEVDVSSIKIALIDDDLQDMSGHQLVPLIRDQDPDLKIVYMAQTLDPEVEVRVRQAGVHCMMDKPIEATLLEKLLRKMRDNETTRIYYPADPDRSRATFTTRKHP